MTDYRSMFDREHLGAWDLPKDRDAVVTISKVTAGVLQRYEAELRDEIRARQVWQLGRRP